MPPVKVSTFRPTAGTCFILMCRGTPAARNGRIDRKLQPNDEVFCHYFVYRQRPEDRVLAVLVRKTETIRQELGSLAEVIDARLAEALRGGIRRDAAEALQREIETADLDPERRQAVTDELEV